jgi:hypothetical protein
MAAPRPSTTSGLPTGHETQLGGSPTRKSVSQTGARLVRKTADRASAIFSTQQAVAEAASHAKLNFEEIHAFHARMSEVQVDDEAWLAAHPEIRSVLHDFLAAVLADKPADVLDYAKRHFSRYFAAPATK